MNNRISITPPSKSRPATARRHVVTVLTQEILDNPSTVAFPIESEHQLCRRFNISRVTVRLALSDLENRGLLYRKHGKGTFAHGRSTRIHRHIGVLIKSPPTREDRPLAEFLRGVQTVVTSFRASIILIGLSSEEWSPELASVLAGVIVVAENVTSKDLDNLKNRKLPFLIVGETNLPGPRILLHQAEETAFNNSTATNIGSHFFTAGQRVAEALTRAFQTGELTAELPLRSISGHDQTFDFITDTVRIALTKEHDTNSPRSSVTLS
jgi:DNA-binding transcriptional regulator YhcF (GntR family)